MDLDSKLFDSIRIKPKGKKGAKPKETVCEWDGCNQPGEHRAPKGRGQEGQFHQFCVNHVREYNKSYNYFAGMDNGSISDYQKQAEYGERPTWSMGVNKGTSGAHRPAARAWRHEDGAKDPFGILDDGDGTPPRQGRRPKMKSMDKKAVEQLGLTDKATADEIKAQYKLLVKKHHPDANGGDRSSEERLQQIITAYTQLKKSGFCS